MVLGKSNAKQLQQLENQLKEANEALAESKRSSASEKATLQAAIESEKRRNQKILDDTKQERDDLEAAREKITKLETEAVNLKQETQQAQETAAKMQQQMDENNKKMENMKKTMEQEIKNRKKAEEEADAAGKKAKQALESQDKADQVKGRFSEEMTAAINRAKELEIKLSHEQKNREATTTSLRTELEDLEKQVKEKQKAFNDLKKTSDAQVQKLTEDLKTKETKIMHMNEEIVLLSMCGEVNDPKNVLKDKVLEVQRELFSTSEDLVKQGEKTLQVSQKLQKVKSAYDVLKSEVNTVRDGLLRGIAGNEVDESLYKHIALEELVRLRLKSFENEMVMAGKLLYKNDDSNDGSNENSRVPNPKVMKEGAEVLGSIGKLEREMRILRSRNKRLQARTEELESELQQAMTAMDDVRSLKGKTAELAGRQRNEKGLREKSEFAAKQYGEQVAALSEHIEKLMVHLKHEAAAKARAEDAQRRLEKEIGQLRNRVVGLSGKCKAKDRTIMDITAGSKVLEDQLRLLDEKQIDLRAKLDWTRSSSQKELKRVQEDAAILRAKWQMALDTGVLRDTFDVSDVMKQLKKSRKELSKNASSPVLGQVHKSDNNKQLANGSEGFTIPALAERGDEGDMPWSDAKLDSLTKQQQLQQQRHISTTKK